MRRTGANTRFRKSSRFKCSEASVRIRPFGVERGPLNFSSHLLPQYALQRHWWNRRRYIWEVESPSAKVADMDKFRCSGVPFRQAMSLHLEPKFKFIIGAEHSDDLRLR
ncbi:MAG: hypothetical protein QOK23_4347 [Gammaproteobacteria bacterium]|nr:hypothetical protein [Gammaproteobacteria bacterium]